MFFFPDYIQLAFQDCKEYVIRHLTSTIFKPSLNEGLNNIIQKLYERAMQSGKEKV